MSQSGETYLALAQSVCALTDPECTAQPGGVTMPQPKSTVLQWNRRDQRFGDLLAVTDQTWQALTRERVPDHHLTEHSFALRLSAGRAKGFRYLEAGTRHLLLALTSTPHLGGVALNRNPCVLCSAHRPLQLQRT